MPTIIPSAGDARGFGQSWGHRRTCHVHAVRTTSSIALNFGRQPRTAAARPGAATRYGGAAGRRGAGAQGTLLAAPRPADAVTSPPRGARAVPSVRAAAP